MASNLRNQRQEIWPPHQSRLMAALEAVHLAEQNIRDYPTNSFVRRLHNLAVTEYWAAKAEAVAAWEPTS